MAFVFSSSSSSSSSSSYEHWIYRAQLYGSAYSEKPHQGRVYTHRLGAIHTWPSIINEYTHLRGFFVNVRNIKENSMDLSFREIFAKESAVL
jgi:hypothetical protein